MTLNCKTVIQHITIGGQVVRLVEAARQAKLAPSTIHGRLQCGWSDEEAVGLLPAPPQCRRPRQSQPGAGRKQRDLPPICDGTEERERQLRIDGDERFKEAMIEAGYVPSVHTAPCTDNPRPLIRPVLGRIAAASIWDRF